MCTCRQTYTRVYMKVQTYTKCTQSICPFITNTHSLIRAHTHTHTHTHTHNVVTNRPRQPLEDRVNVTIWVDDVNDNGPVVPSSLVVHVDEDTAVGWSLVSLGATDPDYGSNGTSGLRYEIVDVDGGNPPVCRAV